MTTPTLVLVIAGALVAFALFWIAVTFAISVFGWRTLAAAYPGTLPFAGRTQAWATGRVGLARYGNVLTVGADPGGVFLHVNPLFRAGHRPIFIPWEEVVTAESTHDLLGFPILVLRARRADVPVRLLGRRTEALLREASGGRLPLPPPAAERR